MSRSGLCIGIDLGGTKIEGILLGAESLPEIEGLPSQILSRERRPTPRHDYAATLDAVTGLVQHLEEQAGQTIERIGVGIPGSLSPRDGTVRNANSTWLNGRPFQLDLQARLGRRIAMANDANCFALSEATDGAGAGAEVVFGVILGTGVGGGLVVRGQLLEGVNGIAGEWGHTPMPVDTSSALPGPRCWCGRDRCVETYLSGPALVRDHGDHADQGGSPSAPDGSPLTAEGIAALALHRGEAGDAARATLERHAARLARALAVVCNIIDPEVIVLGGGLSRIDSLYPALSQALAEQIFSDVCRTRIVPARFGDSSGVRGAAWLGWAMDQG